MANLKIQCDYCRSLKRQLSCDMSISAKHHVSKPLLSNCSETLKTSLGGTGWRSRWLQVLATDTWIEGHESEVTLLASTCLPSRASDNEWRRKIIPLPKLIEMKRLPSIQVDKSRFVVSMKTSTSWLKPIVSMYDLRLDLGSLTNGRSSQWLAFRNCRWKAFLISTHRAIQLSYKIIISWTLIMTLTISVSRQNYSYRSPSMVVAMGSPWNRVLQYLRLKICHKMPFYWDRLSGTFLSNRHSPVGVVDTQYVNDLRNFTLHQQLRIVEKETKENKLIIAIIWVNCY